MEKLLQYLNQISKVFGFEYNNDSFFLYLKSISKPNNKVCNKIIPQGEGGWKCFDCEIDSLSLICNDCFSKMKDRHKGHKISFDPGNYGYCDCGDPNVIIPEGFCPHHQGPFKNKKDLINFINDCLDEKILNKINPLINNIFNLFIENISVLTNINDSDMKEEERNNYLDNLYKMIDEIEKFCTNLYHNNLSLFYLFTLKFTENFTFETNHKCFYYNEDENLIILIKENPDEKHKCICPFFQVLVNLLIEKENKQNTENFFSLFIQNYKNKIITSLSYMNSFIALFSNDNLTTLRDMGYQLLSDEFSRALYDEKNIFFLENFYSEIYIYVKNLIVLKNYTKVDDIFTKIYEINKYLPKFKLIDKIKSFLSIHKYIIDIIFLINGLNSFENKILFSEYQRDGYLFNLFNCELYSLFISLLNSYLIDFNNLESVKYIFNILISKIEEYKQKKENSNDKTFSPHITIIRYYTIFLNRFCFNYSINNNCDLLDSFEYFQKLFPQVKNLNSFLFKELIIFFGFFISQKYSFFSYFGENSMKLYYTNYFSQRVYINIDITLMKYLLATEEIQNDFNVDNILFYSNIDNCNYFLMNLNDEHLNQKNEELIQSMIDQKKNLSYINEVFELILQAIKDKISMIKIAFLFSENFRMKYKDNLFEKLLSKEKNNFENIIKNQIIHHILGNKNLVQRESCINMYNSYTSLSQKLNLELVDKILKENCDIVSSENQLKKFTLKKDYFPLCDIDYIIDYNEKANATNYMMEFQKINYNLLNTYLSNSLSIQEKLYKKIYETLFSKNNLESYIHFYKILITNNNYPLLTDKFIFTLSKLFSFYIALSKERMINNNEEYKILLLEIINNNKLEDSNKILIQYIKKILSNKDIINERQNGINYLKKSLKNKYKEIFKEKNELALIRYSSSIDLNFEESENYSKEVEEICIFCRKVLTNNINDYFGKICFLCRDFFIDILKNKKEESRKKSTRFLTCNHSIHFNCYCKFIIDSNSLNFLKYGFLCPLCKKLSNIIICDFSYLWKSNKDVLKGMSLDNENINDFYVNMDENVNNNNQNFLVYNKNFFEIYSSKLIKKDILIKDLNSDNKIFEETLNKIINDFDSFVIFYNLTNYKKEQIEIWKNILLTIRILCKYKIINYTEIFISKFKNIYNSIINFDFNYINNFEISSIINQFIFYIIILYDFNYENKTKFQNIFQNYLLVYLFFFEFLKNKDNKFEEFLDKKENQEAIKTIFDLYCLKYKIFLIFNEENEEIDLDLGKTKVFLKKNENINLLINKLGNKIIKSQHFEIPKFHAIELPSNFMDFCLKYMNINCKYCNKKYLNYYICLICGNKICDYNKCLFKLDSSGKKEYSLIAHSKICGGGNVLFISNTSSQIIYLLKRKFINSGIYVYLNSFGEYIKDYDENEKYILNKSELQKSIQIFIDITFRKNNRRIIFE